MENNREIKFRAWDKELNKMEYRGFLGFSGEPYLELEDGTLTIDGDNKTLMQFTGLKDKNGKPIFEGDVYRLKTEYNIHNLNEDYTWTSSKVLENLQDFFEDKGYKEDEYGQDWSGDNIEVIGNIYENPELLN